MPTIKGPKAYPHNSTRPLDSSRFKLLWLFPTLSALFFLACGGSQTPDPRQDLTMAIRDFHDHLVWGRWSEAAGYLPAAQKSQFLGAQEQIGDVLRYTEYDVGTIDVDSTTQEAEVTVTLRWYQVPHYTIESTRIQETWVFDEESEYWWLTRRVPLD